MQSVTQKSERFENTIKKLCTIIERRLSMKEKVYFQEYDLRKELIACILGSQVRQEAAMIALDRLEKAKLILEDNWTASANSYEEKVFDVLSGSSVKFAEMKSYRFPRSRARQLSKVRDALSKISLSERLSEISDPKMVRAKLVKDISGIGPKQASMFLRNVGVSYDLAILDTHVIRYMKMKKLLKSKDTKLNSLKNYEHTENVFARYANKIGFSVGCIDWAIWATMRAAKELQICA